MDVALRETCPICMRELRKGERLQLKYHGGRNWWVLTHDVTPEHASELYENHSPPTQPDGLVPWCGRAMFNLTGTSVDAWMT